MRQHRPLFAFLLLSLVWGSSYLFIKIAIQDLGPITLVGLRLVLGLFLLGPLLIWRRLPLPRDNRTWLDLGIAALQQDNPAQATEEDLAAIEQVALDYTLGFYEIDGEKVQGTCHSDLSKRCLERETEGGFDFLSRITWEEIRLLGNTFNRHFGFSPETARKDVEIYYTDAHQAAAKLTGASWFDYLHLMKVNGEWKIVNIIYEPVPRERWQG